VWDDSELNDLARLLREAFGQVAEVSPEDRPELTRRLLAITSIAKRDTTAAVERLETFMKTLAERRNRH
jgi:hypothetical protein